MAFLSILVCTCAWRYVSTDTRKPIRLNLQFMDCGSLDQLYGDGIEESVLSRVAESVARGLQFLKEDLSVIHRGRYLS